MGLRAKSPSEAKGHPAWGCSDTASRGDKAGTGAYGIMTYLPENQVQELSFFLNIRDMHSYMGKGLMITEFQAMM